MSFLLEQTGYSIRRNRHVVGGTTLKPGPGLESIIRNRNVPSTHTIAHWLGYFDIQEAGNSVVRSRVIPEHTLTYTAGTYTGEGYGFDVGDPSIQSWFIDPDGDARLRSLAIGDVGLADTQLVARASQTLGVTIGDSFMVGTGLKLDAGDYIQMPEVQMTATPTRRQSKYFRNWTTTSTTVTLPSNYLAASTIVVCVYTRRQNNTTAPTHTTPSGWTLINSATKTDGPTGSDRMSVYYRKYSSGGALSESFSWDVTCDARISAVEVTGLMDTSADKYASSSGNTSPLISMVGESDYPASLPYTGNWWYIGPYFPVGSQVGDKAVMILTAENTYGGAYISSYGGPYYEGTTNDAGFTMREQTDDLGTSMQIRIWDKTMTSADLASQNHRWYVGVYPPAGTVRIHVETIVYRGMGDFDTQSWTTDSSSPITGTAISTAMRDERGIFIITSNYETTDNRYTITTSGFTELIDVGNNHCLMVADKPLDASGSQGAWAATRASGSDTAYVGQMAYKPSVTSGYSIPESTGTTATLTQNREYAIAFWGTGVMNTITGYGSPSGGFTSFDPTSFVSSDTVSIAHADQSTYINTALTSSRTITSDSQGEWIGMVVTFKAAALANITPPANYANLAAVEEAGGITGLAVVKSDGSQVGVGGAPPYTSTPAVDGAGSAGSVDQYSRGDHVHPVFGPPVVRIVGTSGGFGEHWYKALPWFDGGSGHVSVGVVAGEFWCLPILLPAGTVDRLGITVSIGASGGVARLGIYQATSATDPYPNTRIVDGGEVSTATSSTSPTVTINVALSAGILYWFCVLFGTASPSLYGDSQQSMPNSLGVTPGAGYDDEAFGFRKTQTYGALPATFPSGPPSSYLTGDVPHFRLRYSA